MVWVVWPNGLPAVGWPTAPRPELGGGAPGLGEVAADHDLPSQ